MATPKKPHHSVFLPCKPYIRKYAEALYGSPILIAGRHRTSFGHFLEASLVKERYTMRNYPESFIYKNFTDKLHLKLSAWTFEHIGFDFPNDKVIELNKFLEVSFEEHMHQWVDVRAGLPNAERRQLIEQFVESYGIYLEDDLQGMYKADISLDALVKTEWRMRTNIAQKRARRTAPEMLLVAA